MSNPSSKAAARQNAIKAARARAAAQPTLTGLFADPTPAPEISASQARQLMQSAAPKSKLKTATPTQTAPVVAPQVKAKAVAPSQIGSVATPQAKAVENAPVQPAPVAQARTEIETTPAKKSARAKTKVATPVAAKIEALTVIEAIASKIEVSAVPVEAASPVATTPKPVVAKKTRRARVPENLAEQYGQSLSKRVESGAEMVPVEDETPKKRRSRAETQARRELMKPDDDLIARLRRAQNVVPTRKPEKRPVGWRFDCGRCGRTSYFQTTGALCSCGALTIKE